MKRLFSTSFPLAALALLALGACQPVKPPAAAPSGPVRLVAPEKGVYFGAYMDFGETEDDVTLEGIEKFEELCGKKAAIIASSSYWGEQTFPKENIELIERHGAIPLVFWSPWDKPYSESTGPDRFSLREILAGKWDAYIDSWADHAKAFGKPFFVSLCNEMNGDWFPWSGTFYGEENGGPATFKSAWRYIVDRVRKRGATNILWVFHVNNYSVNQDAWNLCAAYYPGPHYVDWLGLSIYGKQFRDEGGWADFRDLIDWPYKELCELDPAMPIMVAEFGVGEFPKSGSKAKWLSDAFSLIPKYPRIKAAVYWHERWQNADGSFSNLRIQSSPETLQAFRKGVSDPTWLSSPLLQAL